MPRVKHDGEISMELESEEESVLEPSHWSRPSPALHNVVKVKT